MGQEVPRSGLCVLSIYRGPGSSFKTLQQPECVQGCASTAEHIFSVILELTWHDNVSVTV